MTRNNTSVRRSGQKLRYISDIVSELKKVVWLTRREAAYLTALVLIVAGCAAILLGALDYGFTSLIDQVFIGG